MPFLADFQGLATNDRIAAGLDDERPSLLARGKANRCDRLAASVLVGVAVYTVLPS